MIDLSTAVESTPVGVIPVIIGPLQVLIAILPALLLSMVGLIASLLKPATMLALLKLLWRQKVALAVIAGVIVGSVQLMHKLFPGRRATGGQEAGSDWTMFRGGMERRGSLDSAEPPVAGGVNWSYRADVKTFYASPAVVGNRIYVTSADIGPLRDRGAVYCIDADSGALDWSSAPKGYLATFSSPAIAGKYLVCGEGLHLTKTARVVCMDITQRGKVLWTFQTKSHVESSPCIDKEKGLVYVGAGDDGYYCFRLEPGSDGKAQLVWHAVHERCPDAETSPAVHAGHVFAGLGMGGKGVVCLNADTGEQVWRTDTPYPVFGPPTVINGLVVVGMGNGNFIETADQVKVKEIQRMKDEGKSASEIAEAAKTLDAIGEIWCLDEKTGAAKWVYKVPDTVLGAVAADKDRLYFGSRDGHVYCLSLTGKPLGKWNARAPLLTSPAISGGHLYVMTESGTLFGLRLAGDMEPVWEARIGFTGPFLSSPAVARGHVYVGSQQDGLLCLGVPGGQKRELRWDGSSGGPGCGGNLDGQPLPEKGKLSWRFPESDDGDKPLDIQVVATPACLNGVLYVPVSGARNGLLCVRELAGEGADKAQARGTELWFAATSNGVKLAPAARAQEVFFVDGQKGDSGRRLRCLDAADGKEKWSQPVAADGSGEMVLTDQGVLVADLANGLTARDLAGQELWRAECGAVLGLPFESGAYLAVATERPAGLQVLDRPSGKTLWRLACAAAPTAAPVLRKNVIYVGTPDGVEARRLVDGGLVRDWKTGAPGAPLVLAKNRLIYVNTAGQMQVLDLDTGATEKTLDEVTPGIGPLVVGESFVYSNKRGLMVCSGVEGESQSWMNTGWLGRLTCAPVMAESRIYIATDKKGLVCLKSK